MGREKEENGKEGSRERVREIEGKGRYKVAFWNMAGLGNKRRDFWREVNGT